MTTDEIVAAIASGQHDDRLIDLFQAVRSRDKEIALERIQSLDGQTLVGRRVTLTNIRPNYLEGARGVVTSAFRQSCNVKLDTDQNLPRTDILVSVASIKVEEPCPT
jgi:hypothetical protein